MGQLAVMGQVGDYKIVWDSENTAEVEQARKTYSELRAKGFLAFAVRKGGERGEPIREFDPEAERIIMVPKVAGG
jgi:hypothetical protein